jgi:hypothetical protein
MKNILFLVFFSIFIIFSYSIQADTNSTVSSTVVTSTPSTANAPSVVINNSNICKTAVSGAVQTQILGIATGQTVTDTTCELVLLSSRLYSMGMKVAAVSLLTQDYRVWDAMWNAGTYPPINGKIGVEAKDEWLKNKHLIPKGSFLLDKKEIAKQTEQTKRDLHDFEKFIIMGMAMYIGLPLLF